MKSFDNFRVSSDLWKNGKKTESLEVLKNLDLFNEKDVFLRLVLCRALEELNEMATAENFYIDLLQTMSDLSIACPLGLLHYLAFIARTRSASESLQTFEDLVLSESEHVTWDLFPAVAIAVAWHANPTSSSEDRVNSAVGVFRKGFNRLKGSKASELSAIFADFLAFSANSLRRAELELAGAVSDVVIGKQQLLLRPIWVKWEEILNEFCLNLKTIYSLNKLKKNVLNEKNNIPTNDDSSSPNGTVPVVQQSMENIESWLISAKPSIVVLSQKFRIGSIVPETAVLETCLGNRSSTIEESDTRDGGDEPTNHVFRPDVTRMVRFNPQEDVSRKVEIPKCIKNFMSLLPNKPLKTANVQYIADSCMRLLVSITLPPKTFTEEVYANVDRRTRTAIEQKLVLRADRIALAQATAPAIVPEKAPKEEETLKVKKEEIFDPVEYLRKKQNS